MGTLGRLTADQLDLTLNTYDFTQSLSDTLGDHGTTADGFDSHLADTILGIQSAGDPGTSLVDDLNLAAGIGSSIDPNSLANDAVTFPASIAAGESILADASVLAGSVGTPAPPSGGGGGGGGTGGGGTRSACGTHGQSRIGPFDYPTCNVLLTLPIVSVKDGACTFPMNATHGPVARAPVITSVALLSGDPAVWGLSHDAVLSADGKQMNPRVVFTITPARVGHFDATVTVVFANPVVREKWCMSVDVIP